MKLLPMVSMLLAVLVSGCGQAPSVGTEQRVGALASSSATPTSLQKHVGYFDQDKNGVIVFSETVRGVQALGVGAVQGRVLATGLHAVLGPKTSGKMTGDIQIANIHLGVHPGSINFDQDGRFKPVSFTAMFETYDTNHSGSLSRSEVFAMLKARKKSLVSYNLSKTAFSLLLAVASDTEDAKEPSLSRARMQAFYDGSLFYTIARDRKARSAGAVDLDGLDLSIPADAQAPALPD